MKATAGRVLMLVENEFPRDTRVRNEASTLVRNGLQVSIIALRRPGEPSRECVNGVNVYRVPRLTLFEKLPETATRSGIAVLINKLRVLIGYAAEYLYFTTCSLGVSCYIAVRKGFDVVHAHNPPDTLFVVGALHKIFGKKFVFDHHDLSPELYRSRFTATSGLISRALAGTEWLSIRLADIVIVTNESYRAIDIERNGVDPSRVFVVRNGPDLNRVRLTAPDPLLRRRARVLLGYVGAMNPQDGVDYMLRALSHLLHGMGRSDFYCVAIGEGDSLPKLKSLAVELGLTNHVEFTGYISDDDMVRYLSSVDICLDPNPSNPLNDVSTWIKVMEYMALGKPVVSFDLKETRVSAADAAVYATPNDERQYAEAIASLIDDSDARTRMGACGRHRVETLLSWPITSQCLVKAYRRLLVPGAEQSESTAVIAQSGILQIGPPELRQRMNPNNIQGPGA